MRSKLDAWLLAIPLAMILGATPATGVAQTGTTVAPTSPLALPPSNAPPADSTRLRAQTTLPDAPVSFKSEVNLVMVPVVVRDRKGNAIGGLSKEDFRLFDGRRSRISAFSVQRSASTVTQGPGGCIGVTVGKQSPRAQEPAPGTPGGIRL